jgi:hypothetical protein
VRGNPRARRTPLEGGVSSRARRTSPEGGVSPRARWTSPEGGVSPRARRTSLEGALCCTTLVGRGATTVWIVLRVCVRLEVGLRFAFFAGFKRDSPGYLGDPYGRPRHYERHLSVRNVVPTLTSKSAEIYPLMAGAKQLGDTRFILVPVGAVRPAGMCSRHCITLHRSACRRVLQARRERRLVLQVSEVLIEASANIGVKAESMQVSVVRLCVRPCG